jgi:hypothetical protein
MKMYYYYETHDGKKFEKEETALKYLRLQFDTEMVKVINKFREHSGNITGIHFAEWVEDNLDIFVRLNNIKNEMEYTEHIFYDDDDYKN